MPPPPPPPSSPGRNDACPCGSGLKYKKCHLPQEAAAATNAALADVAARSPLIAIDDKLTDKLIRFATQRFGEAWAVEAMDRNALEGDRLAIFVPLCLFHVAVHGRSVAEHFAAERGRALAADERALLDAQSGAWLSVWEVEQVIPNYGADIHDLLTGERRRLHDISASRSIERGLGMLARFVTCGDETIAGGMHPQMLPPWETGELVATLRRGMRQRGRFDLEQLRDGEFALDLADMWDDAVYALHARAAAPPVLHNTDGDLLLLVSEEFTFAPADRAALVARLRSIDGATAADADDSEGDGENHFTFTRPGNAQHKSWENTVVGTGTLSATTLEIGANSIRRAAALRVAVDAVCGSLLTFSRRREKSAKDMFAAAGAARTAGTAGAAGAAPPAGNKPPELLELEREMRQHMLDGWIDEPIPALGNKSPRAAVRTPVGREKVERLLKDFEYRDARTPAESRPDYAPLRAALEAEIALTRKARTVKR